MEERNGHAALQRTGVVRRMHRVLYQLPTRVSLMTKHLSPLAGTSLQAAATPEVYFTAYDALFNRGSLRMGERVLVHAAGSGVGTAAVQLAHHAGAFVIGTAGSAAKPAGAAELGMDVSINYHEQDFAVVVKEKTAGVWVAVIIDFIGGPTGTRISHPWPSWAVWLRSA